MFGKLTALLIFTLVACASCTSESEGKVRVVDPESKDVHLVCSLPPVEWSKDGTNITTTTKGYTIVTENKTLIVAKVDADHMGAYVCKNSDGAAETINLYVTPYVKQFDKSKNMIQDDPLQLDCKGYGHPTPSVQWYFAGEPVYPDDRTILKDIVEQEDGVTRVVMFNGTMRKNKMDYSDAGDYSCVATNDHGFGNATISVRVKDKLAALWPFLGICAEVAILCTIIFIYEKRRAKRMEAEESRAAEEAERLNANNDSKAVDDVRQRK